MPPFWLEVGELAVMKTKVKAKKKEIGMPTFPNRCEQFNQHNIQIYENDLYFRFFFLI